MEEIPLPKKRKAASKPKNPLIKLQGNDVLGIQQGQGSTPSMKQGKKIKASKRNLKNEASPLQQQHSERSNSDSLPDSSSGNEYRALRRKYLLLEEESFTLGNALREVENEVGTLEDEKFALLDQLVVLEGLINPSELQPHGMQ